MCVCDKEYSVKVLLSKCRLYIVQRSSAIFKVKHTFCGLWSSGACCCTTGLAFPNVSKECTTSEVLGSTNLVPQCQHFPMFQRNALPL